MKQVYLLAILCVLIGWVVGDMVRPLSAHKLASSGDALAASAMFSHPPSRAVKKLGGGTIEVAANARGVSDRELPPEVIDARTRGQAAREQAIKEAIGKVFAKDGEWGVGGPLFPMEFTARPRERPTLASGTAVFDPSPLPAYLGPGPWYGPGDARTPPHMTWLETGPQIPEPSTWVLMIAGFLALALRLRRRIALAAAKGK